MLHKNDSHGNFFMRVLAILACGAGDWRCFSLLFAAFRCPPFKILVRVVWANVSGVWLVGGVGKGRGFEKLRISWWFWALAILI